jgi:hypothetical protein
LIHFSSEFVDAGVIGTEVVVEEAEALICAGGSFKAIEDSFDLGILSSVVFKDCDMTDTPVEAMVVFISTASHPTTFWGFRASGSVGWEAVDNSTPTEWAWRW